MLSVSTCLAGLNPSRHLGSLIAQDGDVDLKGALTPEKQDPSHGLTSFSGFFER